jgi:alkanesulfonate monooxygenase SsuD/methylene tetrahydromethanopterin reductase-like flavin-dependent oxidoreductase (luciferase family)
VPSLKLLLGVNVDADEGRARRQAEAYIRGQYRMDLERVERWTPYGSAERVAEGLAAHVEAGVDEFVLMPLSGDSLAQYEHCAEMRDILRAMIARPAATASP